MFAGRKSRQSEICENLSIFKKSTTFWEAEKNSEKKNSKKKFGDHSSVHKLSKKSNHKRFYRGSSEKPASQEHRDFTYPPPCNQLADPKLLGDPPSRADSCTCTRVPVRIILIIIVPINSVKKLLPVSNLGSNFKMT